MTRAPVVCLLVCAGCASFVSREEYADYRAVRLASTAEARLLAMRDYASRHPAGHWQDEVQAERRMQDMPLYERGKNVRPGLEFYLRAFPDGVFVAQARSRLDAIAAIEARKREEARRAEALAVARRARDAELRRTWVTRFLGHWVRTLLSLRDWGASIEDVARANPAFARAFGRAPRPRCTTEECVKYYEGRFAVPVPGGTRIERAMALVLRLRMRDGRLWRAELLMPGWGFSRWIELEERRSVVDALAEQRAEAVAWARARTEPLLAALPGTWDPEPGVVLGPVSAPAIGPIGEITDTTAEDPGAPANRIDRGGSGVEPEPPEGIEDLTRPAAPTEAPDMVLDPLRVNRDARAALGEGRGAAESRLPASAPGAGETMVLAPMAVPVEGEGGAAEGSRGAKATMEMSVSPRVERAFRNGALRVVVFAAATSEDAPAYDGVVIEQVSDPSLGRTTQSPPPSRGKGR